MSRAELIERLRNATGPSRYIDCCAAVELNIWPAWYHPKQGDALYTREEKHFPEVLVQRAGMRKSAGDTPMWHTSTAYGVDQCLPAFTASLDATVALVERMLPGWSWMVERDRNSPSEAWLDEFSAYAYGKAVCGATPALALLLALLSALDKGGEE